MKSAEVQSYLQEQDKAKNNKNINNKISSKMKDSRLKKESEFTKKKLEFQIEKLKLVLGGMAIVRGLIDLLNLIFK